MHTLQFLGNFLFRDNFKLTEKLQKWNKQYPECTLYLDSPLVNSLPCYIHCYLKGEQDICMVLSV